MNNMINEHDMTKKMLDKIRESTAQPNNDSIDVQGQERKNTEDTFASQVTRAFKFDVYKVYPNVGNVVLSGSFTNISGTLQFQFNLAESDGLFINSSNLQLTRELLETLQHLQGYHKNWVNDWSTKLRSEYKPTNN